MHNILWGLLTHREIKIHTLKYLCVWWSLDYYPNNLGPSSRNLCLTFPHHSHPSSMWDISQDCSRHQYGRSAILSPRWQQSLMKVGCVSSLSGTPTEEWLSETLPCPLSVLEISKEHPRFVRDSF